MDDNHVEITHWNPTYRRFDGRLTRRIPYSRPVNNFGDMLGPLIVEAMIRAHGRNPLRPTRRTQLLSVGSVIHLAQEEAVVWGSGVNGKVLEGAHRAKHLDIRAVRGPRTREFLAARGHDVPEIYGDPAMLLPKVRPGLLTFEPRRRYLIVNNFRDPVPLRQRWSALSPQRPVEHCLSAIAQAELVIGSSLHGLIVAEALGIPARAVLSKTEPPFKYDDYYRSTGRTDWHAGATLAEAIKLGGERPPELDIQPLEAAFPADLWASYNGETG